METPSDLGFRAQGFVCLVSWALQILVYGVSCPKVSSAKGTVRCFLDAHSEAGLPLVYGFSILAYYSNQDPKGGTRTPKP